MAVSPKAELAAVDRDVMAVTGTLRKVLQRGDRPPPHPAVERTILDLAGIAYVASEVPGELEVEVAEDAELPSTDRLRAALAWSADDLAIESQIPFDSDEERLFLQLVAERCGPRVARWFYPQASLDRLLEGAGVETTAMRRVDFLFAPPWAGPVVFEIDGAQHAAAEAVDEERDSSLADLGIPVIRVSAADIRERRIDVSTLHPSLSPPDTLEPDGHVLRSLYGPVSVTWLGLAIAEGLDRGFLPLGGDWTVEIVDPTGVAVPALRTLLELLASVDVLWAGEVAPCAVDAIVRVGSEVSMVRFERDVGVGYSLQVDVGVGEPDLIVRFEPDRSPLDELEAGGSIPRIVMRSSTLPVLLSEPRSEGGGRELRDSPHLNAALRLILNYVFAKEEFREGQVEPIVHTLRGGDSVVLLPTGAGKSLIYQLAGLLMPGRTLIVDPIVSLIEDQVASLRRYGIDRAVPLSSAVTRQGLGDRALQLVERGDALFVFVAPERLQQESFRGAMKALTGSAPINLAVIDEAHCVSEWGHDFRPSYLGLGDTIRSTCRSSSGTAPPILALTGTASRAVLRDVLIELGLDRADSTRLIRPSTFDRPELTFDVIAAEPGAKHHRLKGYLKQLPQLFGSSPAAFFRGRGRKTALGLVFCPHVNGEHGVVEVARTIRDLRLVDEVKVYSGSAPKGWNRDLWERDKREAVEAFRTGRAPVLVATKAFGMGIDIPNIRYTIHFGLPASIESFYQEAGRAGRDRKPSRCAAIVTVDETHAQRLLSDRPDDSAARDVYEELRSARVDDDVVRQLFFHFNSFPGEEQELAQVDAVLREISAAKTTFVELPFAEPSDDTQRERAIYRLKQVGLIADYSVDWGARSYRLRLSNEGTEGLDQRFLEYAQRVQPGQRVSWQQRVEELEPTDDKSRRARELVALLIELVYETVERSRRRALREVAALLRPGTPDALIRRRIEDYFREGDVIPMLERLLEREEVVMRDWLEAYGTVHANDAGELRGATARLLESYPDHPGLRLGRAFAEVLLMGDQPEFRDNVEQVLRLGPERYGLDRSDLGATLRWLLDACRDYAIGWAPFVWVLAERYGIPDALDDAEEPVLKDEGRTGESVFVLRRRLDRVLLQIDRMMEEREYER